MRNNLSWNQFETHKKRVLQQNIYTKIICFNTSK
jgi:hypothetical protein